MGIIKFNIGITKSVKFVLNHLIKVMKTIINKVDCIKILVKNRDRNIINVGKYIKLSYLTNMYSLYKIFLVNLYFLKFIQKKNVNIKLFLH